MAARNRTVTRSDLWFLGIVFLVAGVFHWTYAGCESPSVGLGGDASNIAGFTAATDHPELFVGDALLGDPANFRFYSAIQVRVNRWLVRWTGDYGLANNLLLGPTVALYLLGWYLFGCLFWRDRWFGALWALLQIPHVPTNLGEFWGLYPDVLPRFTFQALLPWLLCLVMAAGRLGPRVWPLLTFLAGSLVMIHPVSAPGWGLAVLWSLWFLPAPGLSQRQRLVWMGVSTLTLMAALTPFTLAFMGHTRPPSTLDPGSVKALVLSRISREFVSVPRGLIGFVWHTTKYGVLPLALGGMILRRSQHDPVDELDQERLKLARAWGMGLLLVAVAIPIVDQFIALLRGRLPLQFDLIRHLRYLVPFVYGVWFWPLVRWCRTAQDNEHRRRQVLACLVVAWGVAHHPFIWGRLTREDPSAREALVATRREVPPRGRIMVVGARGLAVRYAALRPVVFAVKDGGCFATVQPDRLQQWHERRVRYSKVMGLPEGPVRCREAVAFARDCGAEYLLLAWSRAQSIADTSVVPLFRNETYGLFRLDPQSAKAASD